MFDVFSTRQVANFAIFGLFFLFIFIKFPDLRGNTKKLIIRILDPQVFLIFDLFTIYEAMILLKIVQLPFWDNKYYIEFAIWLIGSGYSSLLSTNNKSIDNFKLIVLNQFYLFSILEYFFGLVTFNIIIEIILSAFISILVLASSRTTESRIQNFIDGILAVLFIILTVFTLRKAIINIEQYTSWETLISLLFPLFFYSISIPYLYLFLVYTKYEVFFVLINHLPTEEQIKKKAKKNAIRWCMLSAKRIQIYHRLYMTNPNVSHEEFKSVLKKEISMEELAEQWFGKKYNFE